MMGVLSPWTRQHVFQTGKLPGLSDQLRVAVVSDQLRLLPTGKPPGLSDQLRVAANRELFHRHEHHAPHVAILPPEPPVGRVTNCTLLVAHSAFSVLEDVTVSDE